MKGKILILIGMSLAMSVSGQKSKVLAVRQMIDAGKFDEAKEAIDQAVEHSKTSDWARTYYIKGLLCQTAYEQGIEKKDSKKTSLYPDQLYVAYNSYEKALELNASEKIRSQIRQKYFLLSNDFRKLGESHYALKDFKGALRAFEHAIFIGESELIEAKTDTSLMYNAGMAAFESKNWEKSITYLTELHEDSYAPSTSLLLSRAYVNSGDSIKGEEIMMSSLEQYAYGDTLVMYVTNHLVGTGNTETAISVLDKSIEARPDNYRFLWARALVYETRNQYKEAIQSFLLATALADDRPELYYHLGVCYYNIGIELREAALEISDNDSYRKAREEYLDKFREAVRWFERSYELDPHDEKTVTRLQQLYYQLQMKDKLLSLEG
jgi:tetratricopeptide (TPR) repeat protein